MTKWKGLALGGLLLSSVAASADEGAACQLTVAGERTGNFAHAANSSGDGMLEVYGWSHEVISPRDAASGLPTGKRQLTVEKSMDGSSPLLMRALVDNENLTAWRLDCWHPSRDGDETQHYSTELINGSIAGIRAETLNNKYPENMKHEVREHVQFVYDEAIWTSQDGEVTSFPGDDWQ